MPEHCTPRNFEFEREQLWGGGPIVKESDLPVSFIVRGAMPRRPAPDDSSPDASEESAVKPRGLPPPRYKPAPKRQYLYRPHQSRQRDVLTAAEKIAFKELLQLEYGGDIPRVTSPEPSKIYRQPWSKTELPVPLPPGPKPPRVRGRQAPDRATAGPDRKHACPAEKCGKMFTKRAHLVRHIESLHTRRKRIICSKPFCYRDFATQKYHDEEHQPTHTHYQEIFLCTPEDNYKGVHLQNPHVVEPKSFNIKPFAALPIATLALNLWRYREAQRREGFPVFSNSDCDRYFAAHPEQVEPAFRGDPEWRYSIIPPGEGFTSVGRGCLEGSFKVNIKPENAQSQ